MELLIATLCDSAIENQGKLNVIGAFDAIVAQAFPAGFNFTLALRFSFTSADHGSHRFSLRFVEEGEEPSKEAPNENTLDVNMPEGSTGFSTRNVITPMQGTVKKAGNYQINVHYDDDILVQIPLRVLKQNDLVAKDSSDESDTQKTSKPKKSAV